MAHPATLTLLPLVLLTLGAGCLDPGVPSSTDAPIPTTDVAPPPADAPSIEPVPEAPATPPCPEDPSHNNYGTWTQVGGDYIVSPYGDYVVVYYRESNHCQGLQTKADWPSNPDTEIVAVPLPVGPVAAKA